MAIVVLFLACVAAVLWYNEPAAIEAIFAGQLSVFSVFVLFAGRPELLGLVLIAAVAVVAAVLLPRKPA